MDYHDIIARKSIIHEPEGIDDGYEIQPCLMDFQCDIVKWALRRGRAAIFADCGLGKTLMQLEWARVVHEVTGYDVIILAPLAVATQTVHEGRKFDITVKYCREQSSVEPGITITNYEMIHHFDADKFGGIVLDESSILKSHTSKTRNALIDTFEKTPFKLACTATPSPNDYMELCNHSEFLGIMSRVEMLSMFFVHDGSDTSKWRLKGHAEKPFWEWVCSWAVNIRKPSDLGYEDGNFVLPPLEYHHHIVEVDRPPEGFLFPVEALTLSERQAERRSTIERRVEKCSEIVNATDEPFLIWCNMNAESEGVRKECGCIEVTGSDKPKDKEGKLIGFSNGDFQKMVSKPKLAGFGMNWQHCNNVAFVGLSDSYEQFYQAVRRCWRFGQTKPVHVHIITAETEGAVVENIKRKEKDAMKMADEMVKHMADINAKNIRSATMEKTDYIATQPLKKPSFI
jgi:superfamily II DNA or RNA helicase